MGAEIQDGAVLVARAILNSSLWTMRPEDRLVAITAICLANWRPRKWWNGRESMDIGRGQFVRSWATLSEECQLSIKTVRTSVQNLEKVGFLARKRAGHLQVFTIPKYDHYQDLTKYSDSMTVKTGKVSGRQLAADGQATGSELATNNKGIREEGKNISQEEGAAAPARLPEVLGVVEEGLKKARPETPGADPVFRHLWDLAHRQNLNSRDDTLRRYLKGWIAQKGAAEVEAILMRPDVVGKDVKTIQDYFFNSMKGKGFV